MTDIHVGFQAKPKTGKSVNIPLQHTIVACITRYGKSTTLKQMKKSLPSKYKVLFIDVKRPRDYEGLGTEIPIYLEDRTEPVGLKNLLEASGKMGLKFEFSELIKICKQLAAEDEEGRYGFADIYNGISRALKEKMHPIRESKLLVLQHLLGRLVKDLDKIEIVSELQLPDRYNVMNLSGQRRMVQHIAVYSTIKWILEKLDHVIIVLDELPDFAPQRHGTPAKDIIIEAVRKGGASEIWLWLAGQTITGVDKEVLKECNYWILGRQREKNEAQRVLDQIPFRIPGGLNYRDIMTLLVGHAIVVSEEAAYFTYVQHPDIDEETARKVAVGELSVKDVLKILESRVQEDEDLVWKEKYEQLQRDFEKRVEEERQKAFKQAMAKVEEIKKQWNIEELQKTIMQLKDEKADLEKQLEDVAEAFDEGKKKADACEQLQRALAPFLPAQPAGPRGFEPGSGVPSEVVVTQEIPQVTVKRKMPMVEGDESNYRGQLIICIAEGFFDEPRKLWPVRKELQRRYGVIPRADRTSQELVELCRMHLLERFQEKKSWSYRIYSGAKERIKTKEVEA